MADWQTAAKACGMRDDEYPLKAVLRVAAEVERIKARVVELENELACQSCKEYRAEVAGRLDKARAEGWKAGAEAMREKAAVYLDGAAKTWHDDAQPDRADDADNYAHAVRALPIPEPGRCGCNGDYPCDGAHR
jgi:hypothetical protein